MSNISKIKPNGAEGDEYELKDAFAREEIQSTKSVSGNPLTLTDAAPINAEKLEVVLEPKQDLHGQSYPYVGGAGYNKLNYDDWKQSGATRGTAVWENNGVTLTATGNDCYTYSLNYVYGKVAVSEGDLIRLSWEESTDAIGTVYLFNQSGNVLAAQNNNEGKRITYTVASGVTEVRFRFGVSASGTTISYKNIMLQKNTSETTWQPYSNICPISGYDSVSVDGCGKNLVDASEIQIGYWDVTDDSVPFVASSSWQALPKMRCSGGENYTFSCKTNNLSGNIVFIDKNGKLISYVGGGSVMSKTVETPTNCYLITAYLNTACTEIQLEKGSTATTTYEPYQSTTASITFGQTVYGGKSDFVKGGTKSEWGVIEYDGSEDEQWDGTMYTHGIALPSEYRISQIPICSYFKGVEPKSAGAVALGEIALTPTFGAVNCNVPFAGLQEFKNFLSNNPLQVCYKKATPTTIFTLPTDLKLLENTNNISTDGTTINLGYQQNNVVGELKGEIEQAANNFTYALLMSNETSCSLAYTDDYTSVDVEIPLVQTYGDTQTQQNYTVDYTNCEFAINGVDIICADYQHDWVSGAEWKVIPQIGSAFKQDGKLKVSVYLRNWKLTSSDNTIRYVTLMLDTVAFGKYIDSRTR